jgi:hypothetical protein
VVVGTASRAGTALIAVVGILLSSSSHNHSFEVAFEQLEVEKASHAVVEMVSLDQAILVQDLQ